LLVNSIILTILLAAAIFGFRFYWGKAWSKNPADRKYFRPSRDKAIRRGRYMAAMYLMFGIYGQFALYQSKGGWLMMIFGACVSLTLIGFSLNQARKFSSISDAQWNKIWDPDDAIPNNPTDKPAS
jgi:hypothetical protein